MALRDGKIHSFLTAGSSEQLRIMKHFGYISTILQKALSYADAQWKVLRPPNQQYEQCLHALTCWWYSIPMLKVLTRMAIMMPRLKYLLSATLFSFIWNFSHSRGTECCLLRGQLRPPQLPLPRLTSRGNSRAAPSTSEPLLSESQTVSRVPAQYGQPGASRRGRVGTVPPVGSCRLRQTAPRCRPVEKTDLCCSFC